MLISLLTVVLATLSMASIGYYLACILAAEKFFFAPRSHTSPTLPPVSIMIPLCGEDFRGYENYASFCRQNYPGFQVVFGVRDEGDSSIEVIRKLIADFPERDIQLVINSRTIGENLKVSNLDNMLTATRHEIIVIADSDIRVEPDFLPSVVSELLEEGVGLVTCPYRAGEAPNTASLFEAVGITAGFIPGVFLARWKEDMSFALGATMATTKSVLREVGGFQAIADYLADDYMLGNLIRKAGYEVRLSHHIVETILSPASLSNVVKHQIRWARGTRVCRPGGYAGSLITHGTMLALLYLIAAQGSPSSVFLVSFTLSTRFLMAWRVGVRCLGDTILGRNLWLLFPRDLLAFVIWCIGLFGRRVEWRGESFEIIEGGKMIPVGYYRSRK